MMYISPKRKWTDYTIWQELALYAKIEIKPAILVIVRSINCFTDISKSFIVL